jgi:endoglucanase
MIMTHKLCTVAFLIFFGSCFFSGGSEEHSWIRINLLGYKPENVKVAVWCSKTNEAVTTFELVNVKTNKIAFKAETGKAFGAYGPFAQTYRLDFSAFNKEGIYFLRAGGARSPDFPIGKEVYAGIADFCLQYMRQQRSGYNPFLKDSCHTHDGYTMYGPMPDSTHIDVSGGWHDATDYLQYSMTSANATFHLLAAYRDFPEVFRDHYSANGLPGNNRVADVFDEAEWGLQWLLKMHPQPDLMFNQLADDRDHAGFRLPSDDHVSYGSGLQRPVYFVTGEPQGLGKFKNNTTGTSSIAGKFSSAFSIGAQLTAQSNSNLSNLLKERAQSAYAFGLKNPGYTQTACYREPYFYEETNWTDDMELAAALLYKSSGDHHFTEQAFNYAMLEKQTPWLGADTASHYQWYPFINVGHYELAKIAPVAMKDSLIEYYKTGIERVYAKAKRNAFLRGVPFIWCSNNLQTAFAIQCYWYRMLSGDKTYEQLEQASFDWLLGMNPWGTSMVVGLPEHGDYPDDPHSSLHVLKGYQTTGGLVDGPVYGTIYKKQLGVKIMNGDEYAAFQSDYVVYHDDYGDYATNEPTMDGTAVLVYLFAARESD